MPLAPLGGMNQKLKQMGWVLVWAVTLPIVQFMVLKSLHEEGRIGMALQEKIETILKQEAGKMDPATQRELTQSVLAGVHYFSLLVKKFRGDVSKAILAYNQGPTTVARLYKHGPAPLSDYSKKVLRAYANYSNS